MVTHHAELISAHFSFKVICRHNSLAQNQRKSILSVFFLRFFENGFSSLSMFYMKYEAFEWNLIACILLAFNSLLLIVMHLQTIHQRKIGKKYICSARMATLFFSSSAFYIMNLAFRIEWFFIVLLTNYARFSLKKVFSVAILASGSI